MKGTGTGGHAGLPCAARRIKACVAAPLRVTSKPTLGLMNVVKSTMCRSSNEEKPDPAVACACVAQAYTCPTGPRKPTLAPCALSIKGLRFGAKVWAACLAPAWNAGGDGPCWSNRLRIRVRQDSARHDSCDHAAAAVARAALRLQSSKAGECRSPALCRTSIKWCRLCTGKLRSC